jgi:PAS domain S-box-containing protein
LQTVIVLTTGVALALACAIFILFEWRNSLETEKQLVLSVGRITADASSATLAFTSAAEARKVLAAFRAEPYIRLAALYDADGKLFSTYQAADETSLAPDKPGADGLQIEGRRLTLFGPVTEKQRRYGTLYLQADLTGMYARMSRFAGISILIFIGTLAAAYFLGDILQRNVSQPILSLAGTARSVSQDHNYSVRAATATGAELGLLTSAFNQMLEEIQRQQAQVQLELTERKRAQEAEAREKQLLATTLASIGDAVIVTDARGHVTFMNGEAERLTGWQNEQAAGKPLPDVFQILDENSRQPPESPVEKVLRLGTVVNVANHTLLVSRQGTETPINDSAAPIRQAGGPLFGVVLVFRDFTEQKKANEARARLAAIVESSGDAIVTKNLQGIIQTWNLSAERLLGYRPEEIIGKPITTLIPQDRWEEEVQILKRIHQGLPAERVETVRLTKNGDRIPVSVSISPIKDADGRIMGASKLIHDIREVVAAREALIREKELLATTLSSIGDGVIMTDAGGNVTLLNAQAETLTGWTTAEAAGQTLPAIFRIINEESRQPVENPVAKVLRLGAIVALANHTLLIRKDGSEIPIDDSAAPIRRGESPLFGVVLVFRDFTERKMGEQRLRESEERFRALADNMSQLAWIADGLGWATWYNQRWYDYTGTTFEEMQGRGWEHLHHPEHLDRVNRTLQECFEQRKAWEDIFPLRGRDGNYRWFLSRAFPIRDVTGNITRWFGTNTDITELRDAQQALEKAQNESKQHAATLEATVAERTALLRETIGALEAFSYSIAHDMRAPLRSMQGFADILLTEYADKLDATGQGFLKRIAASASRMDRLIQDVLSYSRVVRADMPLETVNVESLLRGIIESYPTLAPEKADILLESPLPPVLGNEAMLTQVFSNLLGNAVKFVAMGVKPRIRVWAREGGTAGAEGVPPGFIRIHFQDSGIGVAADQHEKIFAIFQRVDKAYEGTGIGLAIVKKAVERMAGKVGVASEPGAGSIFWIEIQRA